MDKGILDLAEENAQSALREFLEGLGYTDVVFVQAPPES